MRKITYFLLLLFFSLGVKAQTFSEGFESTNLPDLATDTWNLGTTGLGSNGVWGVFDNGVGLTQSWKPAAGPGLVHTGNQAAFKDRENNGLGNTSRDYLATPLITIPNNGQLRFWTRSGFLGNQGVIYKIMVAPATAAQNDPAAYVLVEDYTEDELTAVFNVYEEKVVNLEAYENQQVYVAFVIEFTQPTGALAGERWFVDDVLIVEKCLDPTALAANNITQTSAQLSWGNPSGATQWEIQIVPAAGTLGASGTLIATNNYTATTTLPAGDAFTPSTDYKYYVRAICSGDIPSEWIGPFAFSTQTPGFTCASPIQVTLPFSSTDNTGNYSDSTDTPQGGNCAGGFTNFMTGNDVFYSYTATETGAISITMTPTTNNSSIFVYEGCSNVGVNCLAGVADNTTAVREIESLAVTAGTTYIIVISSGNFTQTAAYTLVIQKLNCAAPTDLSAVATGVDNTDPDNPVYSANLSWGNPGGATSWELAVLPQGSPIPAGSGITVTSNTSVPVTTLLNGNPLQLACYDYWVRAACGDGTFSPWEGPYQFCTTTCSSGCNYSFVMTDTFGDGWNGASMNVVQNGNIIQTIGTNFTTGAGPITVSVSLCDGPFQLVWVSGGTFQGEVGVSIVNSFGQTIYTKAPGTGTPGTTLYDGIVDCQTPLCLPPSNVTCANSTTNGATLTWTPNGPNPLSWDVYAVPVGSPAPTADTVPTANTTIFPFDISGLLADTAYVYYVRAVCATGGQAPWSVASAPCTTLPTCPKPTALGVSGITETSATFNWTAGASETAWEVIVLPAGSPAPTAATTGWEPAPSTSFTWNNLTAGTLYDFYVRAVCTPTDSSTWAGPLTFNTTICDPSAQCLYTFNMTDTFGDGWNGNTMNIRQNGVVVATIGAAFTTGAAQSVQVALCNGVPFELFWNTGGFFANEVGINITSFLGDNIFTYAPGSSTPGTVLYSGTAECVVPTCLKPTNVVVSNVALNSAQVQWTDNNTPGAGSWDIIVLPATAPAPLADATGWINVTENPYTINGLAEATNYKVYVRSVCSDTDKSFWSLGTQFNTPICQPSNVCEYTFVMVDTFGDSWNGNTMSITQNGILVATLTGPTNADDTNPVSVVVPLCNNIPFELFWNTGGNFANEVGISILNQGGTQIFNKPPATGTPGTALFNGTVQCVPFTCPKPVQLQLLEVTETTATLTWTEASTATTWEVIVLPAGSPAPTPTTSGQTVTSNPFTFENLSSGTSYVFYVRAVCNDDEISNWSGPIAFNTPITNDECVDAIPVPVNPDQLCGQTVSGTVIGATASSDANNCFGTSDDDVWFSFVATATAHSITFNNFGGSTGDLMHVLYSGACGTLTQLYCSDPEQSTATDLVIGQTYYIRVYTWTGTPNQTSTFTLCIGTIPPPITASTTQYTVPELVQEVLLNDTCASVSNITWSTGTTPTTNGIGYFNQNGSNFPFADGVVLTTGYANSAPGPNDETLSDGFGDGWGGDPDLQAIVNATGNTDPLFNATILEFDFVPLTSNFSFNFLFASEEYGTFQCTFSDVFAFLLTDTSTGITTNLAVIPNTTTPVSVVTIRDDAYNGACDSVNPEYFGQFYQLPEGLNPLGSPTNYNGITVPLTATATVVPGTTYHIKLAIADYRDTAFDSAVFLEGGSFGLGNLDLGDNLLEATNTAVCNGENVVLQTGLDAETYSFQWSQGGEPLEGQTGPNLTVTEEGTYTVTVTYIGTTCTGSDDIVVEFYPEIVPGTAPTLFFCSATGTGTFDLTQNTDEILSTLNPDYTLTYYLTQEDAELDINQIASPTAYTNISNPQTIYVKVLNNVTGCWDTTSFNIQVEDLTPTFDLIDAVTICQGSSQEVVLTPTNFNAAEATYTWTLNDGPLDVTTNTIVVTEAGTYQVTVNRGGCIATDSFTVTVLTSPAVDALEDVTACGSYELPVLLNGAFYQQPNGAGDPLPAGAVITTSQTLYVYAANEVCSAETDFVVTIVPFPILEPIGVVAGCESYVLPELPVGNYYTGPNGTGDLLAAGTTITASTILYVFAQNGTAPVVCSNEISFEVQIGTIIADIIPNAVACDSYTLPALSANNAYFTQSGGQGTQLEPGTVITASQTIYVRAQLGTCTDESSFTVTINTTPVVADMADVTACGSYTLPALGVGGYYTDVNGGGTPLAVGSQITSSQTIYIWAQSGDCTSQSDFVVTINPGLTLDPAADVAICDSYVLPALAVGNYYTAAAGQGTQLAAGTEITSTQTVYIYVTDGVCTAEDSFVVSVTGTPAFTLSGGCQNNAYMLEFTVVGESFDPATAQYQWSTTTGSLGTQPTDGQTIEALSDGQYSLTVSVGDCQFTQTFDAMGTQCTIQKGISVNGDGKNDNFDLEGQDVRQLTIFNRYGMKVYSLANYTNQWRGQSDNGDELPDGTYYYMIERRNGENLTGWIYISRAQN